MLISIIIPCFNRAHLIIETLQSIEKQSYHNWECIIIDDGSTDQTIQVVKDFIIDRSRFSLLQRPLDAPKGANACRNIGLRNAKGDYIVFFDSDDLMTVDHLLLKVNAMNDHCDMVVARTLEFQHPDPEVTTISPLERYHFKAYEANLENYMLQKVNWLTYDTLISTKIAKKVAFNESLHRGQEYNYYCKLLVLKPKIKIINDYLTLRRMHDHSIKSSYSINEDVAKRSISKIVTLNEIKDGAGPMMCKKLISQIVLDLTACGHTVPWNYFFSMKKHLVNLVSIKAAFWFTLATCSQLLVGKNHFFRTRLKVALSA